MTIKRKKFTKGIRIKKNAEALELEGEITIDSADNKIKAQLNGVDESVVTEDQTQTLTNKTHTDAILDGDVSGTSIDTDNTLAADSDTKIASQKAVKAYVDSSIAGKDDAIEINYDNSTSGLTATEVQSAIDEVEGRLDTAETGISDGATALSDHLNDAVDAHDASAISNVPAGNLAATDVQGALDELQSDVDTRLLADGGTLTNPVQLDVKKDTEANLITYALTASNGQLCFATDSKQMFQVIDTELKPVGGGGATSFEIEQAAHGFALGDGIYHNGTTWVKGLADDADTLAYYTIVEVADVNTFIAADFGRIEVPSHGYTVGEYYFLSNTVAGQATSTEPSQGFSNPLFYVEDANTLQVKVYRPAVLSDTINLDELGDVSAASPTDSQVLAWDNGNQRWEAKDAVSAAADVTYSNATSGLAATDAQAAIDEVEARVDSAEASIVTNSADIVTNSADIVTTDNKLTNSVKGDVLTHNGTDNVSLPVGLDGQFIVADSDEASGLKYTSSLQGKLNPVTDWSTPEAIIIEGTTTDPTKGTVDTDEVIWRRVGQNMVASYTLYQTTAGTSGSGQYLFNLPNSLVADLSVIKGSTTVSYQQGDHSIGEANITNGGGSIVYAKGYAKMYDSTRFVIRLHNAQTESGGASSAAGDAVGSSIFPLSNTFAVYKINITVPIQGWTSGLDAAVQDIQLTAQTANTMNVRLTDGSPPNIVSQDYDFIDSVSRPNTGRYQINFKPGIFTVAPSCQVSPDQIGGSFQYANVFSSSPTSVIVEVRRSDSSIAINSNVSIEINKQGADVNKSQVIAGTFENINSSDLVVVEGSGNAGTVLTANVTNIDFIETRDLQGAWDGTTFTATKTGIYMIAGYIDYTTNVSQIVNIWKNGVQDKAIGRNASTISDTPISGQIYLEKGDFINFRINGSATLNNSSNHNISITQSADYEAIVKNLNDAVGLTAYIKDVKPSGTSGGTFTAGSWQTRDLNTVEGDTSIVSLSSNQFTLAAGKYEIEAFAPALTVNKHKIKLYNITDSSDDIIGSTARAEGTAGANDDSVSNLMGSIVITSSKVFEIQHQCNVTKTTDGFGLSSSFGVDEVYTQVKIKKVQ